ncbi:MAG: phage baseplate assembly protein V, partial [Actinomycetia bacterium]|nr:phage baseplate assembly protein V [Actinomycetes bacterium]
MEISFGVDDSVAQTFKGTITEIEGRRSYEHGYAVVLKGHGPTKLMDDVSRTRPFLDSKIAEVVKTVLSDRGASVGTIDSTATVFPLLLQQDETDYEFIRRLCRDAGLWLHYDGEKMHATSAPTGKGAAVNLGSSLASFNLRMAMSSGKLEATAWSFAHSDQVSAEAKLNDGEGSHEFQQKAFSQSKSAFPDVGLVTPSFHPLDSAELSDWLKARTQAWGADLLVGEGSSFDIGLGLGGTVEVGGAGKSGGKFVIVEIEHGMQEGRRGGYANRFRCLPLNMAHAPANPDRLRVPQLWGAKVLDNVDPEKLGRIKVILHRSNPRESNANGEHWVRVTQPFAGANMGTWWLPEIDDEVVVGCLEGDLLELV